MLTRLFQEKYGEEIHSILLADLQISARNIKMGNDSDQLIVKTNVERINQSLGLKLDVKMTKWAFNFSG